MVKLTDSSYELPVYADSELAAEKINPDQKLEKLEGVKSCEESF